MTVLQTILLIRLRQLYRMMQEVGLVLLILVLPLLFIGILGVLEKASQNEQPFVGALIVLLLLSAHMARKDAGFLQQLPVKSRIIYLLEYSTGLLPFSLLFLLLLGDWKNPLVIQLGAVLVASVPPFKTERGRTLGSPKLRWFPLAAFEWRCGLRQYWWLIGLLYLLGLFLIHFVGTLPLLVLLLAYGGASAYNPLEGKELIEQRYFRKGFLRHKLWLQLWVFNLFLLPHYVLFLIFHHPYWYLLPAVIAVASVLHAICLFYKYANFVPGRVLVRHQMILAISAAALFTPLMPIFLPVLLVYLIIQWRKALKNLDYYYAED